MEVTPTNFSEQWGQPLRNVEFDPTPLLPDETSAFFRFAGLPKTCTVGCSRFRFESTSRKLSEVWRRELDPRVKMPLDWNRFWHLGEVEYIQSQAWICIEEMTGRIVSIDVEIDDPITEINSSILLFMTCLKIIRDWHQDTGGSMEEFWGLTERLESEVPESDAEEYWLPFLEYAAEESEDEFEVSVT